MYLQNAMNKSGLQTVFKFLVVRLLLIGYVLLENHEILEPSLSVLEKFK